MQNSIISCSFINRWRSAGYNNPVLPTWSLPTTIVIPIQKERLRNHRQKKRKEEISYAPGRFNLQSSFRDSTTRRPSLYGVIASLFAAPMVKGNKPSGQQEPPPLPRRTSSPQRGRPRRWQPGPRLPLPGSRRTSAHWRGWPPRETWGRRGWRTSGREHRHHRA